jgi:tetratricopeptide (TPR) repeat protein
VPGHADGGDPRYWAFISYSHKDAAFGRRLHRLLEHYVLPKRLWGCMTPQGDVPKRLVPIFRDRDDLAAANDLSAEVHTALDASRSLVVVCSPAAAASRWVSREVETYRAFHPERPILAALVEGDPSDAFPEAIRKIAANGEVIEPLAADFTAGGDGMRLGRLKLVAGIVGIGLDELIQRDSQRRLKRVTAVTAAALTAMVAMGILAGYALNARAEAERERGEAEGLIEFMLTDLRSTLKGVGRLDAMTAVNERALLYYSNKKLDRLPPDSLERRARILHAMGEDEEARGKHDAALAEFREARRTTATLLAAAPNDPDRIFDHAQSEFWIGYVYYQRDQNTEAKVAFENYKRLADQLISIDPNNPKYLREAGYAEGNLCSIAFRPPADLRDALRSCSTALKHMEAVARRLGNTEEIAEDIANRHAWLADVYRAKGDGDHARSHRMIQERILNRLMQTDPKNMLLKTSWIAPQRILAKLDAEAGQKEVALARLHNALTVSDQLVTFDPSNKTWAKLRTDIYTDVEIINNMSMERKPR